jgi:RNA 3'-terminal phosphate cyclase (ATP)
MGMNSVHIDGSHGEGGGQILRTSLALAAILERPLRVDRIRAGRKPPGLRPQHLKAVEALAEITGARTEGARIGSEILEFVPGEITSGRHRFDVGSAGALTLVLQGLLLPLCLARETSHLTLVGGTHVPWSPPYHYFSDVLLPTLKLMGISVRSEIDRWGWYPRGGGIVRVEVEPCAELMPISLCERGRLKRIVGLSVSSNLPDHVAKRQREEALKRLREELKIDAEIEAISGAPGNGPGSFIFLAAESEGAVAGFSSLGGRGKPAEKVAAEAVDLLRDYLISSGALDPHLADQIVPFIALAKGKSSFTTSRVTEHLLTNLWVVGRFLDVKIVRIGEKEQAGRIEIRNE